MKNIINYILSAFLLIIISNPASAQTPGAAPPAAAPPLRFDVDNPLDGYVSRRNTPTSSGLSDNVHTMSRKALFWRFPKTGDPSHGLFHKEGEKPNIEGGDVYEGKVLGTAMAFQFGMPQVFWIRCYEDGLAPQEAERAWVKLSDADKGWALADATRWWQMQKAMEAALSHKELAERDIALAKAEISRLEARLREIDEMPAPGWYEFWKDSKPSGMMESFDLSLWREKLARFERTLKEIEKDLADLRKKKK